MATNIKEVNLKNIDDGLTGVVILPVNYSEDKNHRYHSSSLSFYKYAKNRLDISYLNEPEVLLEQQSGEWIGPVILITHMAYTSNPEIIAIICGVIANYITDFFKGTKRPTVSLKIIYKETKSSKFTEIEYKGGVDGLSEIKDAMIKVAKKNKNE